MFFTLWVMTSLIIDLGRCPLWFEIKHSFVLKFHLLSAYCGNLIAMLTNPARSKALNTFEDVANEDVPIVVFKDSVQEAFLQTSTDRAIQKLHQRLLQQSEDMSYRLSCKTSFH